MRGDKKDPLTKMMTDVGFPVEDDAMNPSHTSVFSFPMKVDDSAVFRTDMTAIEQLELWKVYQENWCEHKPSVTISSKNMNVSMLVRGSINQIYVRCERVLNRQRRI